MSLFDVFQDLGSQLRVYHSATFGFVPEGPGAYAWFYPLLITSHNILDFIVEMQSVQNFDHTTRGIPSVEIQKPLAWRAINVKIDVEPRAISLPSAVKSCWEDLVSDQNAFDQLRRIVLRSSILMPPLYVGKAVNLSTRLNQHRGHSSFKRRYESYAAKKDLINFKRTENLLFVAIKTDKFETNEDSESKANSERNKKVSEVVEEILKYSAGPPYSER